MDLALNNLQWLICHKIQPTIAYEFAQHVFRWFVRWKWMAVQQIIHGHTNIGQPVKIYIHQLCAGSRCHQEDLLNVMINGDGWPLECLNDDNTNTTLISLSFMISLRGCTKSCLNNLTHLLYFNFFNPLSLELLSLNLPFAIWVWSLPVLRCGGK